MPTSDEPERKPDADGPTTIRPTSPTRCGRCRYSFDAFVRTPERCPECGWDARAAEELDPQCAIDERPAVTPGVIGCGLVWVGIFACGFALISGDALLYTVPLVWLGAALCVYGLVRFNRERVRFPLIIALGTAGILGWLTYPAILYPALWVWGALFG